MSNGSGHFQIDLDFTTKAAKPLNLWETPEWYDAALVGGEVQVGSKFDTKGTWLVLQFALEHPEGGIQTRREYFLVKHPLAGRYDTDDAARVTNEYTNSMGRLHRTLAALKGVTPDKFIPDKTNIPFDSQAWIRKPPLRVMAKLVHPNKEDRTKVRIVDFRPFGLGTPGLKGQEGEGE